MKRLWLVIVMLLSIWVHADAAPVNKIVGMNADATGSPSPIPLSLTLLCNSTGCPLRSSFSYTDSTRFWGTAIDSATCRTSTDGGATWANCTTQAFSPLITSVYAGAADGSVIAAGQVAGPVCTIKRSTDNGTIWTTVFTEAVNCAVSSNEGQYLFCLSDGRCEYIVPGVVSISLNRIYRSFNNGVDWVSGETSANTWTAILGGAAWDGLNGIMGPNINASTRSFTATADVWANSAIWGAGPDGCVSPVIYNTSPRQICFVAAGPSYQLFNSAGASIATLSIPDARLAVFEGGTAYGYATNVMYIAVTRQRAPLPCGGGLCRIGVYVSRDNLASFNLIGEISTSFGDMRSGNMFTANGCVYMSVGNASATAMIFAKVCI